MNDRCDSTLYEGDVTKYISHLIHFHEADNPRLLDFVGSKDPEVWTLINQVHTAIMEESGLGEMASLGYCVDQWGRWQQGMCHTYAKGLLLCRRDLRLGIGGWFTYDAEDADGFPTGGVDGWRPRRFFVHDDQFAYDSAGRHPLPYYGVERDMDHVELDADPIAWEDGGDFIDIVEAVRHSVRNGILIGTYERSLTASSTT